MGDDYDDYDERPPVPTFSDGSYTNKGAKSSATASRMSASKNSLAVASRASATMLASMQQLKNSHVQMVNSRGPVAPKPALNHLAIQAAEKRERQMLQHIKQPSLENIAINTIISEIKFNYKTPTDIYTPPEYTYVEPEPYQPIEVKLAHISEIYRDSISNARSKKTILLETYELISPKIIKKNIQVKLVKTSSPQQQEVDQALISLLSVNLSNILSMESHNEELLNELNRHKLRVRISLEEPLYKRAVDNARINKNTYFTSDT